MTQRPSPGRLLHARALLRSMVCATLLCAEAGAGSGTAALEITAAQAEVELALPAGSLREGDSLIVELDGYDVTAVADVEATRFVLRTGELGLAPGKHTLRVMIARENGDVDTGFEQVLEVFQRAGVYQSRHGMKVLLGASYRIDEDFSSPSAGNDRAIGNATFHVDSTYERRTWSTHGVIDTAYDSDTSKSVDGQRWLLPGYELRAERRIGAGRFALALGDDTVPIDNLLFSGFSRRGLNLAADALDGRFTAQAFTLHSDPVVRLDADVVPTSGSSVAGGFAMFAPFAAHPEALVLTSGWVDGESELTGFGIQDANKLDPATLRVGGSAWNFAGDSWAWQRALWFHIEYARSEFDADGIGNGADAEQDDASHAVLQLSSGGVLVLPALEQWNVGIEQRRVGAHFFGLGNLMLPGDLLLHHAYSQVGFRGASLSADLARQHSDVDDDPTRPRIERSDRRFDVAFTPDWIDASKGMWRWLGTPSFSASFAHATQRQTDDDSLALGFDVDDTLRTQSYTLNFSGAQFTSGFTYSTIERDDDADPIVAGGLTIFEPGPDLREHSVGINAAWTPHERFSLSPQWQRTERRELDTGNVTRDDLWGLQVQATLLPEKLFLQAGWNEASSLQSPTLFEPFAHEADNSGGSFDVSFHQTFSAGAFAPVVDWHLRGAYNRAEQVSALDSFADSEWQVLLAVEVTWSKDP